MIAAAQLQTIAHYPPFKLGLINSLVGPLNKILPQYDITSVLRMAHFLAQACEETAYFRTLVEYASGAAYEGRADLGNTHPGDGVRFKGRGIFDVTGRTNYVKYGDLIGVDLVDNPGQAADPENAVWTACEYWDEFDLNTYADRDDIVDITRKINGSTNGLTEREAALARAKVALA